MHSISVVIPTLNRAKILARLLERLAEEPDPPLREIIVVDDGSTDETQETCRALAAKDTRIRLMRNSGKGQGSAKRVGTSACTSDLICYLDDDALPESGWSVKLQRAFDRGAQIVQMRIIEAGQVASHRPPAKLRWDLRYKANWASPIPHDSVDFCQECAVVIRRDVLRRVPFHDPDLEGTSYGESISFSLRARATGYRISFEPQVCVLHLRPGYGGGNSRYPGQEDYVNTAGFIWERFYNMTILKMKFCRWLFPLAFWTSLRPIALHLFRDGDRRYLAAGIAGILDALRWKLKTPIDKRYPVSVPEPVPGKEKERPRPFVTKRN